MPALMPFTPTNSVTRAVTTSTANVALARKGANQVLIYAPAANAVAFIKFGDSTVTATTSDIAIAPGFNRIFTIPPDVTHVAAITAASTATLYFTNGDGQ